MKKSINKDKQLEGYIALPVAIEQIRGKYPWWPETSIRDAVKDGDIPSVRASLRKRAKIFVRMEDVEEHYQKCKEYKPNEQ